MPCGLTGALATFSKLMDKVLDGLVSKNCPVYLDDVINFGSLFEETAPLQELLKKSVHFRWGDEQEQAFINLKDALCKAPVLAYPDPDTPYIVDTDASNLAISAVLSQVQDGEEKVIMF